MAANSRKVGLPEWQTLAKRVRDRSRLAGAKVQSEDKPAIWLNKKIMGEYRPRMKELYYDPSKYDTYLEQLGIKYPTVH